MLSENCPVVSPTSENSDMSLTEQENQTSDRTEPFVEIHPIGVSQQESFALVEELDMRDPSEKESDSISDSDSESESNSDFDPQYESNSEPKVPSEEFPALPRRKISLRGSHILTRL